MARTTLALVKEHLRVDGLDTSQDNVLAIYTDAAEEHVEMWCDRKFGATFPKSVTAAVLLYVGELYENRESLNVGSAANVLPTLDRLLQPFRSYDAYFGAASLPPAVAALDDDPIFIGDDWSRVWRWKDEAGAAINVTGYTGTFELYQGETLVHSGALVVSNAAGGEFTFAIQDSVTTTFEAGEYWYRARVTSPGGEVTTLDRKRVNAQ